MTFEDNLVFLFVIYHINISLNRSEISVISELTYELSHNCSLIEVGKGKLHLKFKIFLVGRRGEKITVRKMFFLERAHRSKCC